MNNLVIQFKNVECTEDNHYYSDYMSKYTGKHTDKVVLAVYDEKLRVINWIYPSEFKQYNGTN